MEPSRKFMFFRLIWVPLLLLGIMFCGFGALASFEPREDGSIHFGWLLVYLLLGLGAISLAGWLIWSALWRQDPWDDGLGEIDEQEGDLHQSPPSDES
jgi:hypothetical protein